MSRSFGASASAKRGVTLAEVLLASFLALLVSSILLGLILPSIRHLNRGSKQTALGQEAMLLADVLERDVAACAIGRVSYLAATAPETPATHWLFAGRLSGLGPQREQRWDPATAPYPGVIYRFRPGQQLSPLPTDQAKWNRAAIVLRIDNIRIASGNDFESHTEPPMVYQIEAAARSADYLGTHKLDFTRDLAPHLKALAWSQPANKGYFEVRLDFERTDVTGKPVRLTVERVLVPRNTLRTE